jgi:hypothetical protein
MAALLRAVRLKHKLQVLNRRRVRAQRTLAASRWRAPRSAVRRSCELYGAPLRCVREQAGASHASIVCTERCMLQGSYELEFYELESKCEQLKKGSVGVLVWKIKMVTLPILNGDKRAFGAGGGVRACGATHLVFYAYTILSDL